MNIIYLGLLFLSLAQMGESQVPCNINLNDPVNNDDIQLIVKLHNQLRSNVAQGKVSNQPQASDMLQFNWDSELAKLAQDWANGCVYAHNHPNDSKYLNVGQNIATFKGDNDLDKNFTSTILGWFDEVDYIPTFPATYDGNRRTGNYIQMVWANTSSVGCGYSKFVPSSKTFKIEVFYVCNYGPAGNYKGSNIYKLGPPASSCPYGTTPSLAYPGLCAFPTPA